MLYITRVGALDGEMLDIELSNGSLVLLNLTPLIERDEVFAALRRGGRFLTPMTDGESIYWRDGSGLGLEEVFALLGRAEPGV